MGQPDLTLYDVVWPDSMILELVCLDENNEEVIGSGFVGALDATEDRVFLFLEPGIVLRGGDTRVIKDGKEVSVFLRRAKDPP